MTRSSPDTSTVSLVELTEWFNNLDFDRSNPATRHAEYAELLRIVGPAQAPSLRAAAERVCWFDWSDNDMDAVAAIDALRKAITADQPQTPVMQAAEKAARTVKGWSDAKRDYAARNDRCTCAAMGKKNIPHARNCPALRSCGRTPSND